MDTSSTTPPQTPTPTLARLSFWVPPERMAEFEVVYETKVVPILKAHDLTPSSERGRATPDSVFTRLFEVASPSEVAEKQEALEKDAAWQEALRDLGTSFGTAEPEGPTWHSLTLYSAPARPGKVVPAGPGKVVPAGRGTGHWRTYDVTDGLAVTNVQAILQDREGVLWFGTWGGGASRYDGHSFTTFTKENGLASNFLTSVFQDREGNLWFSANGGVSRYDGHGFTTFTTREGLATNGVYSIIQDREGNLWFGTTSGGVSRYDGHGFTTFTTREGLATNGVYSIIQDREGNLWFGTAGGASRYDGHGPSTGSGQSFTNFTARNGLVDNGVFSIFQDREGNLWFGTQGSGVSRYDGKTWTTFTIRDGLAGNYVSSIIQDREGVLWFGTFGSGVSRYDGHGFTTFTTREGLAGDAVKSIIQDREGHLWVGTEGGVSRYDGKTFTTFMTRDGLAKNSVPMAFQDREGHLWFGSEGGGVSRYDGHSFTTFTEEEGLADNWVQSMIQDREGVLWFGTFGGGVSRYDGKTFTTFTKEDGLAGRDVRSILQDREGVLWFGTFGGGVIRYDRAGRRSSESSGMGTFTTFTKEDGLAGNGVELIIQDREGNLWVGGQGGVSRYDGNTPLTGPSTSLRTSSGQAFTTFTLKDGLAGNRVNSIIQDREGNLWVGGEGGVSRYDGQNFTNFTIRDGLASNWVDSILQDREGVLWFSSGGVNRYDGQVFQTLTRQDGLVSNRVLSILQDREGNLWFGTKGGVTRYRKPATSPPPAFIDTVVADRRYEKVSELSAPSSVKLTAFEFHGISLKTRPEAMVYRYRLKGYEEEWKNTHERRAEYQDLPIGDYTFEVVAVDRDLVYSEQPATVRLTVVPDPRIKALTEALSEGGKAGEFVGKSEALRRAQAQLSEVAWTDVTVLILGETGTGKGLAARAVHALSSRREGPFIQVNCGAIPEGLVESELFGHEKGAFTGAVSRKLGKVEVAEGGTLFLDEIGDLPLNAQVKLLRILEERTFERVGGTQTLKTEARVIAATNRDLKQMVAEDKFREDLYFRLQAFPVRLPPLRERREDIPLLSEYFMRRMAAHLNKNVTHLMSEALARLNAYDWPGNIRELEHAVQRAVIVCRGPAVRPGDIVLESGREGESPSEEAVTLEENERRHIQGVLERTGWIIRGPHGAAALLGLHEATLRFRMKKLGIRRSER